MEGNAVPPPLSLALGHQIGAVISETSMTDFTLLSQSAEIDTQKEIRTETRKRKRNPYRRFRWPRREILEIEKHILYLF